MTTPPLTAASTNDPCTSDSRQRSSRRSNSISACVPLVSWKHTTSNRPRREQACLYRLLATHDEVEQEAKRVRVFQEHTENADVGEKTPFAPETGSGGEKLPNEFLKGLADRTPPWLEGTPVPELTHGPGSHPRFELNGYRGQNWPGWAIAVPGPLAPGQLNNLHKGTDGAKVG